MKRSLIFILCMAFVLISCANSSKSVQSASQSEVMEETDESEKEIDKYANIDLPPLHAACNHDVIDKDLVRKLVSEGYDINEYAVDRMTPLRLACNRSHIDKEAVKLLVELGAHTGTIEIDRYSYAYSPLKYACDRSDIDADALRLLFELGAKPESWIEERDGTALMAACNRSKIDVEAVKVLIENGASLKAADINDLSLAMMALDHKRYSKDAIMLLLDSGLDVNLGNGPTKNKLMTMVVHDLDLTKKVIEKASSIKSEPIPEDKIAMFENALRNSGEYDEEAIAEIKENLMQRSEESLAASDPIHVLDKDGTSVLSYAAAWGNKDVVRYLLDQGAITDINKPNERGLTPIFFAAYSGNLEIVKMLVDAGADIRAKDNANNNVLAAACRGENNNMIFRYTKTRGYVHYASDLLEKKAPDPEMIRYFLDAGVSAGEGNNSGLTPLHLAAYNELTQPEVLKMLINAGANPNAMTEGGLTPLMYTASVESADILIKKGADVKAADKDGMTALHHAMRDGHADVARVLLKAGADIHAKTNDGEGVEVFAQDPDSIQLMAEHGFDYTDVLYRVLKRLEIESPGPKTLIALLNASKVDDISTYSGAILKTLDRSSATKEEIEPIIHYLKKHGIDFNGVNNRGMTVLMIACNYRPVVFKTLIEQVADINQKTPLSTPFAYCASHVSHNVYGPTDGFYNIQLMMERGANVNVSDAEGVPAIVHLAERTPEIIPDMLKAGANPNAAAPDGRTPLMVTKSYNAAKALIDAGADVNARKKDGTSVLAIHSGALDNAKRYGREMVLYEAVDKSDSNQGDLNIVKLLLNSGAAPDSMSIQFATNPKVVDDIISAKNDVLLTSEQIKSSPTLTTEMVKKYMANGGKQSVIDDALQEACFWGQGAKITALAKGGANPNTRHHYQNRTPLMMAVAEEESYASVTIESIQALIDAGAQINDTDEDGNTALMAACYNNRENGDRTKIIQLLLNSGADVKMKNNDGQNVLFRISNGGVTPEMIKDMIQRGADPKMIDKYGQTPLHTCWNAASCKVLIEAGVKINVKNKEGETALMSRITHAYGVAEEKLPDVCDVLINAGIDLKATDKKGKTAFHYAVIHENKRCADDILKAGFDINTKDKSGKTVIEYLEDDHTMIRFLKSHGATANPIPLDEETRRKRAWDRTHPRY